MKSDRQYINYLSTNGPSCYDTAIDKTHNITRICDVASDKPLTATALKIIANIAMVIDHIAAVFILPLASQASGDTVDIIYRAMRMLGRPAIVIFGFFVAEGFTHTRDLKRYAERLALCAVISEVIYDILFYGQITLKDQNVIFTLFLSLITLMIIEKTSKFSIYLSVPIILISCLIGYIAKFNYGVWLPAFIAVLYLFRDKSVLRYLIPSMILFAAYKAKMIYVIPSVLTLLAIALLYSGKPGKKNTLFGYAFYPAHMIILLAIKYLLALV